MKRIVVLCLSLLTAATVSAQTAGQERTVEIDLQKAIEIALDENPTIQVAGLEIERQKLVKKETTGNLIPNLSATGQYSRAIVKSEMMKGVSLGADNTVNFGASLNIPLIAPTLWKTLKLNDEQMKAAVEAARGSKLTLINDVKKAYYNVLLAERSLQVLKTSEQTITETVNDTKAKFEHGLASEYDPISAQVQLSNLRPNIIQTENSIEVANKLVKMYLNLPQDINLVLTGTLDDFVDTINNFNGLDTNDISANTDLRSMDAQLGILHRQLEVTQTQRMPTLAAFGTVSLTGLEMADPSVLLGGGNNTGDTNSPSGNPTPTTPSTTTGSPKFTFGWMHPISVGLQLSVPIFSGGTRVQQARQVKNSIKQLEIQRDYLKESINVQMNTSANAVITAREMMLANQKTVDQAQKAYDISKTRYDAGMGTILEVNTAELSLTTAKMNYTQAIYDYLSAMADYDKVIGKEVE
jgi:outer membrane protein TolC